MIGYRINEIISHLGIKKKEFANRINVSQAFVSQLTKGVAMPSDRTIADICREFNVNEHWLRTGEGTMFVELNRNEAVKTFLESVIEDTDDSFRKQFIELVAKLDLKDWKMLEEVARKLIQNRPPETEETQEQNNEIEQAEAEYIKTLHSVKNTKYTVSRSTSVIADAKKNA